MPVRIEFDGEKFELMTIDGRGRHFHYYPGIREVMAAAKKFMSEEAELWEEHSTKSATSGAAADAPQSTISETDSAADAGQA